VLSFYKKRGCQKKYQGSAGHFLHQMSNGDLKIRRIFILPNLLFIITAEKTASNKTYSIVRQKKSGLTPTLFPKNQGA
jgi:hypothetical protein